MKPKNINISIFFQISFVLISIFCFLFIIFIFNNSFFSIEYWPSEKNQNPILKNTELKNTEKKDIVLIIKDVIYSNINKSKIIISGFIKIKTNKNIKDNSSLQKIFDSIIIKSAKIENNKLIKVENYENYNIAIWQINMEIYGKFNYKLFPFDDHIISLKMQIPKNIFKDEPRVGLKINENLDFGGWIPEKKTVLINENNDECSFNYNKVGFFIAINKTGSKIGLSLLIPMYILLFVAMFAFSIDPKHRIRIISGIIVAINGFRIVIERMSPQTSYLLISDIVYILFLIFVFLIFLINIIDINFSETKIKLIIAGMHITTILFFGYFISPWLTNFL
jgi:hypothetical protein